jgi:homeobox protein engrailed
MLRGPTGALLPAWVFATRYSDRPSSGRSKQRTKRTAASIEKKPRTAFSPEQLGRLRTEFAHAQYLTESRREALATELGLGPDQLRVWFQNRRAQAKRSAGGRGQLADMLSQHGLYNH